MEILDWNKYYIYVNPKDRVNVFFMPLTPNYSIDFSNCYVDLKAVKAKKHADSCNMIMLTMDDLEELRHEYFKQKDEESEKKMKEYEEEIE